MAENLEQGDRVEWNTPQGKTSGTVKEKITGEKRVGNQGQTGTKVKGSDDDPRYLVESEKSGKQAAHKPGSLEKTS
jgi:Hypervirulence associated proteins TUDOR domain